MGDREGKFEYAGQVAAEQAAEYLDRIATGIRAGHIALGAGSRRASFAPTELLKLEIEAEAKDGKGSVALELSWKPVDEAEPELEILSEEEAAEMSRAEIEMAAEPEPDRAKKSPKKVRKAAAKKRR